MVVVKVHAGLGNQLFQYAFAWTLAKRHGTKLLVDASYAMYYPTSSDIPPQNYQLQRFGIKSSEEFDNRLLPLLLRWMPDRLIKKIYIAHWKRMISRYHLTYITDDLEKGPEAFQKLDNDCYLDGYFQYPGFFDQYRKELSEIFVYQKPVLKEDEEQLFLQTSSAVAINLRRKDYLKPVNLANQGICPLTYYEQAIKFIKKKVDNPTFFLIADDIEDSMQFLEPLKLHLIPLNHDPRKDILADFHYLQHCHHLIIANSSYSWWAAYLNQKPQKIVIAPKQWAVNKMWGKYNEFIIPKEWIRL